MFRHVLMHVVFVIVISASYSTLHAADEIIWQGSIHVGDEPGIYGQSNYVGLSTEFPLTLEKHAKDGNVEPEDEITLVTTAQKVNVISGYDGHTVDITALVPAPDSKSKWQRKLIATESLVSDSTSITLDPARTKGIRYFSLSVRAASDAPPGLYNDFVVQRIDLRSTTHTASFGFHYKQP